MLKFGFEPEAIPRDLSISLGSPNIPPIDMARAFSVFANGGYLIDPYLIETISNQEGEVLYQHEKVVLCDDCEGKLKQQQIAETIAENTDNIVIQSESQTTQSGSESEEDILEEHIIYPPRNFRRQSVHYRIIHERCHQSWYRR